MVRPAFAESGGGDTADLFLHGRRCVGNLSRFSFAAATNSSNFSLEHPGIPASRHPGIPASRHPGIPASRHPGIAAISTIATIATIGIASMTDLASAFQRLVFPSPFLGCFPDNMIHSVSSENRNQSHQSNEEFLRLTMRVCSGAKTMLLPPDRIEAQSLSQPRVHYRRDIDGLRGIAVLAVVLFHAGFGLSGGYVGVDVFFVISGYLITGIIVREFEESRFRLWDFVVRRIRRIAPAALLMTACVVLVGVVAMPPAALDQLATSAFCQQFFLSNVYFAMVSGYFAGPAERMPLLHTWTLSVEEQFYVLLPLGLPWMLRRGKVFTQWFLWVLTLVSFIAGIWASTRYPIGAFFLLPTRVWELSAGSLLALHIAGDRSCVMSDDVGKPNPFHWPSFHWPSELLSILAIAMLGAAFVGFDDKIAFPGYHAALPVIGTVLLVGLGHSYRSMVHRLLSSRLLVGTGLISYSLYLWHWPIFSFLQVILSDPGLSTRLWAVLASLIIAIGSWRWIEQPARNPSWLKPRRIVSLYGTCVMILAAGTLAIAKTDGLPSRMKPQTLAAIESLQIRHQSLATSVTEIEAGSLPRIGSTTAPPTFLVWGDSHALAASESISRRARDRGLGGWIAATGGNPPLLGVTENGVVRDREAGLMHRNEFVVEFIRENRVKNVFLIAAWQNYPDDAYTIESTQPGEGHAGRGSIHHGIAQTVQSLQSLSARVWIVRQAPGQPFDVGQTYLNHLMFGWPSEMPSGLSRSEFEQSRRRIDAIFRDVQNQFQGGPSIHWIDPVEEFFDSRRVGRTVVGDRLLYVDTNHLTSDGVDAFYANAIDAALELVMSDDRTSTGRPRLDSSDR